MFAEPPRLLGTTANRWTLSAKTAMVFEVSFFLQKKKAYTNYLHNDHIPSFLFVVLSSSLEYEREGKHKGHCILTLDESKDIIKANLKRDIKELKSESKLLENARSYAEREIKTLQEVKEQMKEIVRNGFKEIRDALAAKEVELIGFIDEKVGWEDDIVGTITRGQNFLGKLPQVLEKGKSFISLLDVADITPDIASEISSITDTKNEISKLLDDYESIICKNTADCEDFESKKLATISKIRKIKEVSIKRVPLFGPKNVTLNEIEPLTVVVKWDRNKLDDSYFISLQKEGTTWSKDMVKSSKDNVYIVTQLEPGANYLFSVRAVRKGVISKWTIPVIIKTNFLMADSLIKRLKDCSSDAKACVETLKIVKNIVDNCNNKFLKMLKLLPCNDFLLLLLSLAKGLNGKEADLINTLLIIIATYIKNPFVCEQGCILLSNIMMNGKKMKAWDRVRMKQQKNDDLIRCQPN